MDYLVELILVIPALLLAVTAHEFSHAKVADVLGDPTPRHYGRLSLNPIKHLDPIGALMILLVHIGWAKPVPINPSYFRNPRQGMLYVSLAGPLANFTVAFFVGLVFRFTQNILPDLLLLMLFFVVEINIWLGLFNLIPIPPLDGSKILAAFLSQETLRAYLAFEGYGMILLILLLTVFRPAFLMVFVPLHNLLRYLFLGFA